MNPTNANAPTHPLAKLTAAEAALAAQIDAAAARLDAVGTLTIDAALERLRVSALAAADRLARAGAAVKAMVAEVLDDAFAEATAVGDALSADIGAALAADATHGATVLIEEEVPTFAAASAPTKEGNAPPAAGQPAAQDATAGNVPSWLAGGLVGAISAAAVEQEPAPVAVGHHVPLVVPPMPREKYPACPVASTTDGPSLFDEPTPRQGVSVAACAPVGAADGPAAVGAVKTPQRKRRGR